MFRKVGAVSSEYLYRLANRVLSLDVSAAYLLDCRAHATQTEKFEKSELRYEAISAQQLLDAGGEDFEFSVEDARTLAVRARCLAAYEGDSLIGYMWHAGGDVAADLNTPGAPFQGFGLELGDAVQYLFKVYVARQHRRRGVNQRLCRALADSLRSEGLDYIITLTEWNNFGFQKGAERAGFKRVGNCVECLLWGKSLYWFPRAVDSICGFVAPKN